MNKLLALEQPPSAIVTAEPSYTAPDYATLLRQGLHVPEDIALMGIEIAVSRPATGSIVLIEIPLEEMDRASMDLLRDVAGCPTRQPPRAVRVGPRLAET